MARGSCPIVFCCIVSSLPRAAFSAQLSRRAEGALPWSTQLSRRSRYALPSSSQLPRPFGGNVPAASHRILLLSLRIPVCISIAEPAVTKILMCSAVVESAALSCLVAMVFLTASRRIFCSAVMKIPVCIAVPRQASFHEDLPERISRTLFSAVEIQVCIAQGELSGLGCGRPPLTFVSLLVDCGGLRSFSLAGWVRLACPASSCHAL